MTNDDQDGYPTYTLDKVDRGVLFALQQDARNTTIESIAERAKVSASTVRNRIQNLEEAGIIEGYVPQLNYENAGYPLRVVFVATASAATRTETAWDILAVEGVVDIREMLTSQRNLFIEVVATSTRNLTSITNQLTDHGLEITSSEIVTNHYCQPFGKLEF